MAKPQFSLRLLLLLIALVAVIIAWRKEADIVLQDRREQLAARYLYRDAQFEKLNKELSEFEYEYRHGLVEIKHTLTDPWLKMLKSAIAESKQKIEQRKSDLQPLIAAMTKANGL